MNGNVVSLRSDTDVAEFNKLRIIKEWRLRPLKISDKALYDKYVASSDFPVDIWSSNFAYLWAHSRIPKRLTIFCSELDGLLVTWILTAKGRLYLPCLPVGPGTPEQVIALLSRCEKLCSEWNEQSGYAHKPVVAKLSSNQLEYFQQFESFNKLFKPKLLTGIERHLSVSSLTTLTGKKFSSIRYKLNKFHREFPNSHLRFYQPSDFDAVLRLGRHWKETSGTKHNRILDEFYFEDTLKNHQDLGLENLVVENDGQIIGVTIGGLLPNGQAWGYLTKFDSRFDGISEYLVIAMALRMRELDAKVELINVGTDFGNKQLAMAKEKYRPAKSYQRYALKSRR
jgi:hypothetical protein